MALQLCIHLCNAHRCTDIFRLGSATWLRAGSSVSLHRGACAPSHTPKVCTGCLHVCMRRCIHTFRMGPCPGSPPSAPVPGASGGRTALPVLRDFSSRPGAVLAAGGGLVASRPSGGAAGGARGHGTAPRRPASLCSPRSAVPAG